MPIIDAMPGLLIIAHAPLASSLKAVAMHAYPDCGRALLALDVTPAMTPDEAEARARELLAQVRSPQALILTDVFGATPCNVAQRLADGQTRVVAGVNVPMLWRDLSYAVAERIAQIDEEGREGQAKVSGEGCQCDTREYLHGAVGAQVERMAAHDQVAAPHHQQRQCGVSHADDPGPERDHRTARIGAFRRCSRNEIER